MKRIYQRPETDSFRFDICHLMVGSAKDQYSIGGNNSQWPESGEINDDYGNGPGVSQEKQPMGLGRLRAGNSR